MCARQRSRWAAQQQLAAELPSSPTTAPRSAEDAWYAYAYTSASEKAASEEMIHPRMTGCQGERVGSVLICHQDQSVRKQERLVQTPWESGTIPCFPLGASPIDSLATGSPACRSGRSVIRRFSVPVASKPHPFGSARAAAISGSVSHSQTKCPLGGSQKQSAEARRSTADRS